MEATIRKFTDSCPVCKVIFHRQHFSNSYRLCRSCASNMKAQALREATTERERSAAFWVGRAGVCTIERAREVRDEFAANTEWLTIEVLKGLNEEIWADGTVTWLSAFGVADKIGGIITEDVQPILDELVGQEKVLVDRSKDPMDRRKRNLYAINQVTMTEEARENLYK